MMVRIDGLRKNYPGFGLEIDSLVLPDSGIAVLFGNNGAGKTTFIRCCLDMLDFSGTVSFDGERAGGAAVMRRTSAYLGEENLIDFYDCGEYFGFVRAAWEVPPGVAEERLSRARPLLGGLEGSPKLIRDLSSGNRRKVGLVGQLLPPSRYLFLDEPFNDLDPTSQHRLKETLRDFSLAYRPLILLSSHAVDSSMELADRAILLEEGRVVMDTPVSDGNRVALTAEINGYFARQQ